MIIRSSDVKDKGKRKKGALPEAEELYMVWFRTMMN